MLPEGWVNTPFEEIGRWGSGGTPKASEASYYGGNIPWIRSGDLPDGPILKHEIGISDRGLASSSAKWVSPGSVLVAMYGATIGKLGLTTYPVTTNQAIASIETAQGIDAQYLFEYLRSQKAELISLGQGGAQPNISQEILKARQLPLPPEAEQRRIVAKLDTLTARLVRARAELDRVSTLAVRQRFAILEDVFRGAADHPLARIEDICRVGTGSTPKRGERRYYENATIPWVTSGAVNLGLIKEPTELITEAAIKETNCKLFPAGSILVALYGEGKTRGMVATLGIAAATNQALAVLHSFESRVYPEWARLFLLARYEETRSAASGGVQPNLNLGIVKSIALPVPPLSEQASAIAAIKAAFTRADRLEAEAARARKLIDRLEAAILAKAFRGELVPQDPNDEPASVLLERIRAERAAAPKPKRGRRANAGADA